jgi:hypothetical protein
VSGYLASITAPPPAFAKQHGWQRHWHRVAEAHTDRYVAGCRKPIWREGAVTADVAIDVDVCEQCREAT